MFFSGKNNKSRKQLNKPKNFHHSWWKMNTVIILNHPIDCSLPWNLYYYFRWFMDTLGFDKSGQAYMWNGSLMTFCFFTCRILCMPQYWYKVYSVYGTEKFARLGSLQYVLIISCFVLDVINLYWFYKLCKGIHKMMVKKKSLETNLVIKKEE